jgi:hypothetical protein
MSNRIINSKFRQMRSCASALLVATLLAIEPAIPVYAQEAGAPPRSLQIVILDGEGALNNIRERTAREPIVQVQDENHKPVAGAIVLFSAHGGSSGAAGTFANGLTTLSVPTDAEGKAVARGFQPNQNAGSWEMAVTASVGTLTANAVIHEKNFSPSPQNVSNPGGSVAHTPWYLHQPVIIASGIIVIGVVVSVVAVKSNQGTTINTGTTTVGPPTAGATRGFHFTFGKK